MPRCSTEVEENDLRLGPSEMLELAYELVQIRGGVEKYFHQHGVISGYAVAFNDIWDFFNIRIEFFLSDGLYFHVNESLDMVVKGLRVYAYGIARNNSCFFQPVDPGGERWAGIKILHRRSVLAECVRFSAAAL